MSFSSGVVVTVDGQALTAVASRALVSTTVDTSRRRPDLAVLRFSDPARTVLKSAGATIGSTLKVSAQVTDEPSPTVLFDGEITALEAEHDSTGSFSVVRAYDQAHRLHRGRRTASYTQSTASDVASTLARRAGLSVGTVTATSTVYDQVSQLDETDWDLLQRLARDTGFEVSAHGGSFSFDKPADSADAPGAEADDPLVLQAGRELTRVRVVVNSAQQCSSVEVRGWDVATKTALTASAPVATTSAALSPVTPASLAGLFDSPTYVMADVPYRDQAQVDEAAKSLAASLGGSFAELEGVADGNPALVAGAAVRLAGLGAPFDGTYALTTARHRFDAVVGYTTTLTVTGTHDRSLLGLASGGVQTGRAPAGVVIGQVSDVKDPESRARVKLTLPWLSDDYVSDWARTVQPGAGKDRGWAVLPEVGDEVLVCFEHGDLDRPVVVGGLFNGVDTMPTGAPALVDSGSGAVNRRSWVSRLGHHIDLLDSAGQADGITLAVKDDKLSIKLDKVATAITVHADGKVTIEGSQGITLDAGSADLELKGKSIALTATAGATVDGGSGAVEVKTTGQLAVSGAMATFEGKTSAELKGGLSCSVTGTIVKIN